MPESEGHGPDEAPEDRFQKIRAELEAMKLPDLGDEEIEPRLPSGVSRAELPDVPDIETIKSQAWQAKDRFDAKKIETAKQLKLDQESSRGLGIGLVVAYTILGVPMGGLLIGWVADYFLKTNICRGLGALAGFVVGIIIVMGQLNQKTSGK
jgi:hypothetical protein